MRINRASAAAVVLLGMLSGCPGDDDDDNLGDDAGSNVDAMTPPDSGVVECPSSIPEFIATAEDGLSVESKLGMYRVRVIDAKPGIPAIKTTNDWTIQLTDTDGEPVDVGIAAACAFMPLHGHGLPPYDGIEKLSEPGQYKLKGLFFKMSGPWELQLAIDPSDEDDAPKNYTTCDSKNGNRHPGNDYAALEVCLPKN